MNDIMLSGTAGCGSAGEVDVDDALRVAFTAGVDSAICVNRADPERDADQANGGTGDDDICDDPLLFSSLGDEDIGWDGFTAKATTRRVLVTC